jgi:hypothetical protein
VRVCCHGQVRKKYFPFRYFLVLRDELETIAEGVIDDWGMGEGPRWRAPQTERKEKRDSSLRFAAFGMTATEKRENG